MPCLARLAWLRKLGRRCLTTTRCHARCCCNALSAGIASQQQRTSCARTVEVRCQCRQRLAEQTPYAKFGRTGPEPAGQRDCADPDAHVFRTVRRGLCFTGRCCFRSGDVAWLPLSTVVNVGQATSRIPVELGRLTSRDRPRPQTSSGYWRGLRAGSLWTVPT